MPPRYIKKGDAEIILVRSKDDPPTNDADYLKDISLFSSGLNESGIDYSQRFMAFDAAGAQGFPLGQYVVQFGPIAVAALTGQITAWLTARYGRKVKAKFDDIEVEARSVEEIAHLLKIVEEHRKKVRQSDGDTDDLA